MIMTYIDCAQVPVFVNEEIDNVYTVKKSCEKDRISNKPMELKLVSNKREVAEIMLIYFLNPRVTSDISTRQLT